MQKIFPFLTLNKLFTRRKAAFGGLQVSAYILLLLVLKRFETAYWLTPNDVNVNFSCFWPESSVTFKMFLLFQKHL